MVFWEVMVHVLSFDLNWLAAFMLNNLFWLFTLYAVIHFFVDGKKVFKCFVLLVLNLWILTAWSVLGGGVFAVGGFLLINYIVKLSSLKIAEHVTVQYFPAIWGVRMSRSICGYSVPFCLLVM